MISSGFFDRLENLKREQAADQVQGLDAMVGVGPWGQSLSPRVQSERDMYALMAEDPQRAQREQLDLIANMNKPNPFSGPAMFAQRGGRGGQVAVGNPFGFGYNGKGSTTVGLPGAPGLPINGPSKATFAPNTPMKFPKQQGKFPNPFS